MVEALIPDIAGFALAFQCGMRPTCLYSSDDQPRIASSMSGLTPIPLKRFFNLFSPTHVFGTTYSLSLAFFESVVFPLVNENLEGCVLFTDRLGFTRSTQEAGALLEAARSYCIAPVPLAAAFHPKVWVLVNDQRAALLVGSGNLTQAGMVDNLEAFEVVELVGENATLGVSAEVLAFLYGIEDLWPKEQRMGLPALRILASLRTRLEKIVGTAVPVEGRTTYFLSSFGGVFPDQWRKCIGDIQELRVASPYFAASTKGLELLVERLRPRQVIVYPAKHPDGGIDLPWEKANSLPDTELRELPWTLGLGRFAHLKLYGLVGADGSHWIFTGSVNATGDALKGRNIEAGLLREVGLKEWDALWPEGDPLTETPLAGLDHTDRIGPETILFHATDTGTGFELQATGVSRDLLPLHAVELMLISGVSKRIAQRDTLFDIGQMSLVRLSEFSESQEQTGRCRLLRLTATAASGKMVKGAAFVDDVESLLSSPIQRRALSSVLDLVDSEGIPDWAGAASLLGVLEEVLAENDDEAHTSVAVGSPAPPPQPPITSPKPEPAWPPRPAELETISPSHVGNRRSSLCLERVLQVLLASERHDKPAQRPAREAEDASDEEILAAGDLDESSASEARVEAEAKKYWDRAKGWLERWVEREQRVELNERLASRLLPASFVLMRWLFRLRRKLRESAPGPNWAPPAELARDFLRRMFEERPQEGGFRPKVERYSPWAFLPLLPDAVEYGLWQPAESDAELVVALFGFLKARIQPEGMSPFPIYWWLLWQRICPVDGDWITAHLTAIQGFVRHTMLGEDETMPTDSLEKALRLLPLITWETHSGFKRVRHLQAAAQAGVADSEEMRELSTFLALVRRDGSSAVFFKAKPGARACPNRRCRMIGMEQPLIRDSLRHQFPVICPQCSTVAIPTTLYDVCAPY